MLYEVITGDTAGNAAHGAVYELHGRGAGCRRGLHAGPVAQVVVNPTRPNDWNRYVITSYSIHYTKLYEAYLQVSNLFDRSNVGGYNYDLEEDGRWEGDPRTLLPVLPVLGIKYAW